MKRRLRSILVAITTMLCVSIILSGCSGSKEESTPPTQETNKLREQKKGD